MGRVIERLFEGEDPVVMEPGVLTPMTGPGWRARIRWLQFDGVRVDYVELDPYRFEVPPLVDRPPASSRLMLVVVLSGTSVGDVEGVPMRLTPKQAALIDGRAAMRVEAPEPVRAVRMFVAEEHIDAELLAAQTLPFTPLKDSPLVNGVVGLISGLLQVANPEVQPHEELAVSRPLIALQASLLDEALHAEHARRTRGEPPEARREQIEAYIDQHLADRGLSVQSIASALQVTLRTVHAAFEDSGTTVAVHIRQRRVARAQMLLALRDEAPNVAALAARVGLSRDRLTRAFQASTGCTAVEWWERHGRAARRA